MSTSSRAASVRLSASSLSLTLPDGRCLFEGLDLVLHDGPCALVGANGVGKSSLLRVLAGIDPLGAGRIDSASPPRLLPAAFTQGGAIIDALGLRAWRDAFRRLQDGRGDADDLLCIDEDWARLDDALALAASMHLPERDPDTPLAHLSGGQAQQYRLLGALLAAPEVLLLDEPSQFLDAEASSRWCQRMRMRAGATLVVSHDPRWLAPMPRTLELADGRLHEYPGGLACYRQLKAAARQAGERDHAQARLQRDRLRQDAMRRRDALQRRQSQGRREGRDANLSKLMLDRRKDRAERFQGHQRQALDARSEAAQARVEDTWRALGEARAPQFLASGAALPQGRRVLVFEQAHPSASSPAPAVDAVLAGPVRIALTGPNGSGKTRLLHAIADRLQPLAQGRVHACVPSIRLDQHLASLPCALAALDWLEPDGDVAMRRDWCNRLALLGFDGSRLQQPMHGLSSGERMRIALAAAAYREPPAPLLLLDEPDQHLDFASRDALIALLDAWPGAFVIVSHDADLLAALSPTHALRLSVTGMVLEAWHHES